MRLIDADALMENIESIPWFTKTKNGYLVSGANSEVGSYLPTDKVWEAVNKAHTVDAELVRHEMWLKSLNGNPFCSGCSTEFKFTDGVPKRCPECGARMDKKMKVPGQVQPSHRRSALCHGDRGDEARGQSGEEIDYVQKDKTDS